MKGKVAPLIKEYYPQYYSIESYPAEKCAPFNKVREKWGVFSNFGITPIEVNGIIFSCVERLFQCLKFEDKEAIKNIYEAKKGQDIKMKAKHWVKEGKERSDWGKHIVDVMKFCLNLKYDQVPNFREALEISKGLFIVEDQTTKSRKDADTWGVKLKGDEYVGPNLMGRLLMELRDKGKFKNIELPESYLESLLILKDQ